MLLRTDESGQPYVDIGRTPPLDDGTRLTLVADPGWDAGGPVLRYRRYKADGSLYSHGPDIPVGRAVDNALAVLFLHSLHLGINATNLATSPLGAAWLPIMADRFASEAGWRFEDPQMVGRVAGYIYAAFAASDPGHKPIEFNEPRLKRGLHFIFPVSDTPKRTDVRAIYTGDAVILRYRDVINVARYTRSGVLEVASPQWHQEEDVLPTSRLLGDAYVMIQQAAAFFSSIGHDGGIVVHFKLTNVPSWTPAREPLGAASVDIGPLPIGPSATGRVACFRTYATRLFNHFGMEDCDLVSADGRPTNRRRAVLDLQNLPEEQHHGR